MRSRRMRRRRNGLSLDDVNIPDLPDDDTGLAEPAATDKTTDKTTDETIEQTTEETVEEDTGRQPRQSSARVVRQEVQRQVQQLPTIRDAECGPLQIQPGDVRRLEQYIAAQKDNFARKVAPKQAKFLVNYFPYVELVRRTLPLPTVEDYLDADGDNPPDIKELVGMKPGEGYVILVLRANGNTQVIIPSKSQTSYRPRMRDRQGDSKNVWTSIVEFKTVDLRALIKDDGEVEVEEQIPSIGNKLKGAERRALLNLELCTSLLVATDWVMNVWMQENPNKRSGMGIAVYQAGQLRERNDDLSVPLVYIGGREPRSVRERLRGRVSTRSARITAQNMEVISNPEHGGNRRSPWKATRQRRRRNRRQLF